MVKTHTNKKQSEEQKRQPVPDALKFSTALDQAADAIFITDKTGRIEYINQAFTTLTGYTKTDAIGNTPRIVKSGKQTGRFYKHLWTTILSGKVWRASVINRKKNGKLFTVDHTITPLKNQQGEISHFIGIWKDITEKEELEQLREEFVNLASHELKTPLTSIKTFHRLLQRKLEHSSDTQTVLYITKMEQQITKLIKLVESMLDVSRVHNGRLEFTKEQFDFDALVKDVVGEIQVISSSHTLRLSGESRQRVYADRERIGQVLVNLLLNAIKYSPGTDAVLVRVSATDIKVLVSITDFGFGIAPSEQEKIFERFYRARRNATFPGLGIGLHISSEIVKRHHGTIWVESAIGKGATFHVALPVCK